MTKPLLSVCIPTFQRAVYLEQCIESLKAGWVSGVEIVVSDNASTDGTAAVLERYAEELPLRWQRQPSNVGFDRNCVAVVAMARGEYCWILGSDDCVVPGSLEKIMALLSHRSGDILHFGYIQCDLALNPQMAFAPGKPGHAVALRGDAFLSYFEELPTLSLGFAFVSCFAFRRQHWVALDSRLHAWVDSHYVHSFVIHAMLSNGATVLSINECFVWARGGNVNEWNKTPGNFLRLDALTFMRIYNEIYQDHLHLKALGRLFRRSYPPRALVGIAGRGGVGSIAACRNQLIALGYSRLGITALLLAGETGLTRLLGMFLKLRNYIRIKVTGKAAP